MAKQIKKDVNFPKEVIMVAPKSKKITRMYKQEILAFTRLSKEIRISPKSHACINKPGHTLEFYVETVSVNIEIGKNHSADLVMSKAAWESMKAGAEIKTYTTEEFKKNFL